MGTLTLLPILFYLLIKYLGMCPNLKTKWAQSGHKVDTWAHSLRADGRCEPCHDGHLTFRILPCRGVACYTRNSARRAAYGVRRGAACYALRLTAHRCVRGVNHHSVALPRVAGVARYAPTEEGNCYANHKKSPPYSGGALHTIDVFTGTPLGLYSCLP